MEFSFKVNRLITAAIILNTVVGSGFAQTALPAAQKSDSLEQGFRNPPNGAKPRVWWHWMNGNITKEGINLDIEWMKRTGLGGVQNFDAALATPQVVDKRLVYMTPEWKEAFLFATKKADSLGLEMAIAGSPGWSESGGPWVEPSQAMKKYVWSETYVEGGKPFTGALAKPPAATGPFQSLAQADPLGSLMSPGMPVAVPKDFYADSVVLAYRLPESEQPGAKEVPKVTSSGGQVDGAVLASGDLMKSVQLPMAPVGEKAWIQFEYARPQTIRSVTFALKEYRFPFGGPAVDPGGPVLEMSEDGQTFRPVATMPTLGAVQHTVSFVPVTAHFFRMTFLTKAPPPSTLGIDLSELGIPSSTTKSYNVAEIILHPGARVNRFEEKAAFATLLDLYPLSTSPVTADEAIMKSSVVDLTSKLRADGTLDWAPPAGHWVIVRMGYSLTGITNHPAPPEATGPEVDKLSRKYVRGYIDHYLDNYKSAVGDLMGKRGVQYVITDSWEAGTQNWTDDMIAEFQRRRGYDPRPWLPVLTGRIVESAEASDGFLWDFRKTISDMLAENHYGTIAEALHARGMGVYGESDEDRRPTIGDGMEMKKFTDVPMSAMWVQNPGVNEEQYGFNADVRESASVAHIYGQNLVAAESLTARSGPWAWSPATLKPTADQELAMGLNRFVIHTSVHQPLIDKAPGLALGPFGQWFNRNEVWAEQAQPWIRYLARSSFLLQQGHFAADILYFYGEDTNLTALFESKAPSVPEGYSFDYVNADALIHKMAVKNGRIVTESGMTYRLLALDPNSQHMSLPVLRKLRDLAAAGATIYGTRPANDPSLGDDAKEFQAIGDQMWNSQENANFKVFSQQKLPILLETLKVSPDFEYSKPETDTRVLFVHRRLKDSDLYYVDNRNNRAEQIEATFRITGKAPELWHADTGKMEPASYRIKDGRTTVPLELDPYGTVFVVFRRATSASSKTLRPKIENAIASVKGPWDVSFEPNRGAPATLKMDELSSWSESSDAGVKYFAGHGTYTKTVEAPASWFKPGARLWLDLGDVANLAEVTVNGKPLGIVWKVPYRVDVTEALRPGVNKLEIRVANLWVNRLIGDQQPNVTKKYTFTARNPYKASSPLIPAGLLGPVNLMRSASE